MNIKLDSTRIKRRRYWMDFMTQAYEFMQEMKNYPVEECGEPLISLIDALSKSGIEVTFSDKTYTNNSLSRMFYLRQGLIEDFLKLAEEMNRLGWILHIEDAFRTRDMQRNLGLAKNTFDIIFEKVCWELDGKTPSLELMFRRCTALIATCPKIGTHMSGSAIDISVYLRKDKTELYRGKPYLEMSEYTPMTSPFVNKEDKRNRQRITTIMESHGFMAYPFEFWHYSKDDAYALKLQKKVKPAKYGPVDFDVEAQTTKPIESPCKPLITLEEIQERIIHIGGL